MPRSEQAATDRPRYRRISTRMWGDDKFRRLTKPKPNGQSLWQFLLTGPQTKPVPGLCAIGEAGLAEMLEWSLAGFRKAWRELERLGMVKADWCARLVWIPKAVRHNPPESPNVVRSWRLTLDDMPECPLKGEAIAALRAQCEAFGEGFLKAFDEAFPEIGEKGLPNQDQEQDQEQDHLRTTFEAFREAYPLKEGMTAAWKQWQQIAPNAAFARVIIAGARRYAQSQPVVRNLERGDTEYIKRPKNWLGEGLWTDVPAPGDSKPSVCRHGHTPPCADDAACTQKYLEELRQPGGIHAREVLVS